jgi:hypothetical protein
MMATSGSNKAIKPFLRQKIKAMKRNKIEENVTKQLIYGCGAKKSQGYIFWNGVIKKNIH